MTIEKKTCEMVELVKYLGQIANHPKPLAETVIITQVNRENDSFVMTLSSRNPA